VPTLGAGRGRSALPPLATLRCRVELGEAASAPGALAGADGAREALVPTAYKGLALLRPDGAGGPSLTSPSPHPPPSSSPSRRRETKREGGLLGRGEMLGICPEVMEEAWGASLVQSGMRGRTVGRCRANSRFALRQARDTPKE